MDSLTKNNSKTKQIDSSNLTDTTILHQLLTETNQYRIKLMSDVELERNATVILNDKLNNNNQTYSLESPLFGMNKNQECEICGGNKNCTCHFGLINLPFPIITNTIILDKFTKLVPLLCPICANFPIENAKLALNLRPNERFNYIRSQVLKSDKSLNYCPYCKSNFIPITVECKYPEVKFFIKQDVANKVIQVSPLYIYTLLNNMSNETIEYGGFNVETNNPKNYMTKYITIIPNRLRLKTIEAQSSSITSAYKHITELILPQLNQIYFNNPHMKEISDSISEKFNTFYTQLNARYGLFVDMSKESMTNACLSALSKRDKKHIEPSASMIGRLRDKESSYFNKGVIDMRHKVSCRTVLGADNHINSNELGLPYKICNKLGIFVPVYKENLDFMKQLVASMEDNKKYDYQQFKVIKVLFVETNSLVNIRNNNAKQLAARLNAGDKLYVSLLPYTIVQHLRYPALREESIASHLLIPTSHSCMTIPLAACDYKNADFDGDETNVYVPNSQVTDIECLLLTSIYRQFVNYMSGSIGVFFQGYDTKVEVPMLKKNVSIGVECVYDNNDNSIVKRERIYPTKTVGEFVNYYLDYITGYTKSNEFTKIDKINYQDSKTIIVNNVIDDTKCELNNQKLFLYLNSTIGVVRTLRLIDFIIQLGYNYSFYTPITLGNEIRIFGDNFKSEIMKIHDKSYQDAKQIEESNMSMLEKDKKIYVIANMEKLPIINLLTESAKGSTIDRIGLLKKTSAYYNLVVSADHALVDGTRVHPMLNHYSRTNVSYNQFSIDPCAYGYTRHGYMSSKVTMSETFFDCMMQRKSMYIKGSGVAAQGYLQKRFVMAFGPSVTDSNGAQVYNNKFISPCYGAASLNPRCVIKQPLIDLDLDDNTFKSKYSKRLYYLYTQIHKAERFYNQVSDYTQTQPYENVFMSPFDYEQYLRNCKSGKSDSKLVEEFINQIKQIFAPEGMKQRYSLLNSIQLEYYFRQRCETLVISREMMVQMYYYFINSLVDTGETIGIKASLCIGMSLTQESLDAIHNASGGSINVNRLKFKRSTERFEEIIGGSTHKDSVITLGFYDSSREAVEKFAKREETIYLVDIWTKLETIISNDISQDVKAIHPKIKFGNLKVAKTYIKMVWNLSVIADFDIKLSEVYNVLYQKYPIISFITTIPVNHKEGLVYIYLNPHVTNSEIDELIMLFKMRNYQNTIHGECITNCFVDYNKNTDEWFIKCNETDPSIRAYEKIIYRPEVDPAKCHTTNTKLALELYGVFETGPRIVEEMLYCSTDLSSVGDLPSRHHKTIGLGCLAEGTCFSAVSNSAIKTDVDYLRSCNFEQPTAFIRKAITEGQYKPSDDTVSAPFFGDLPKSGSGYTKVMIFKK